MKGILLVNLGTPAAPTPQALRCYLAEFLSDPRVVELPRALWLPVLYGIVLRVRPARSAEKYAKIWTPEGSPLAVHTRRQAELLAARLPGVRVAWAMRYGEPSIAAGLAQLAGCDERLVLPLYPQYSRSTTESVRDRLPPGTPMVEQFCEHPAYIAALAAGLRRHWARCGRAERLVLSFHGLPQRAVDRGDPYRGQCEATARRLCAALGLGAHEVQVTFQSRFGPAKWLQPYTEPTLVALARAGVRTVDVACPGFVSDCLETLEEIGIGAREAFVAAGGAELRLVPCLNEDPEWIEALAAIALEPGAGAPR
ncbi:MAG: ferrochelatase [Burkholderiales bacterium]|nr:ferrochelatase [Burkholderiales bacterium]